ncbi:MAG: arsenosugar biosynthesis radical SAM protein ArsS [Pseudodesulfovibrio sp.]|nr:arsenosugar biosynthesis radical SAM protein ArsS [Pseudodesulfovibrio sp.]
MNEFDRKTGGPVMADGIDILQVNVGLRCNQSCAHCHLSCSPVRSETMSLETMERVIDLADQIKPQLVDITGGSPEFNVHLREFVLKLKADGYSIQVRTNLSAMMEPGLTDYPEFFAENEIGLVASMPCYLEENVSKMRGSQCFSRSVSVLRHLNELGYGVKESLTLDLVFNPAVGPNLPPSQAALEKDYKREMQTRYGIVFNRLLTITNVPIGRYLDELKANGQDRQYMELLTDSFNPATVDGLMCRHQVNIGWDGTLYDCDFNQALGLPVNHGAPGRIEDFDLKQMVHRQVVTGRHCFACTAGAGSSCGGAIEK